MSETKAGSGGREGAEHLGGGHGPGGSGGRRVGTVARGKALVAKLRAQPGVNPEALAAYLGRFKAARKAGRSVAEAAKVAPGEGPARDKAAGTSSA